MENKKVAEVVTTIANKHNVPVDTVVSIKRGTPAVCDARSEAIVRVRLTMPELTLDDIGQEFGGRDLTTIATTVRKHRHKYPELSPNDNS
tara:strand:- start:3535 stop:3804 length:270 start_codon:yes stop_codon:yes gene_type:complete